MRTQEERDQQTLEIMSALFKVAFLVFLVIAVGAVATAIW